MYKQIHLGKIHFLVYFPSSLFTHCVTLKDTLNLQNSLFALLQYVLHPCIDCLVSFLQIIQVHGGLN